MSNLPVGITIPSVDAVDWIPGFRNVDVRPRLVDNSTGQARLLDSGAQISATMKSSGDKVDNSVNLVAVNGSRIKTYGIKEITIKIGRKAYHIHAVICDVAQDILGMDFVNKYRLGLEWDDFDQSELFIVDKRSKIKAPVKIVTVPTDIIRTHHMEASSITKEPDQAAKSSSPSMSKPVSSKQNSRTTSSMVSKRNNTTMFEIASRDCDERF